MTRDEKIELGVTVGSLAAFLLGWRRLAGGITLANGAYYFPKSPIVGAAKLAIGSAFLLWPEWPEAAGAALKSDGKTSTVKLPPLPAQLPAPRELQMPPTRYISLPSFDRPLDGDWMMLDVRDIRDAKTTAKAANLQAGDTASLVLQNKNGPYMVFDARVIGGSSQTMYNAQWASGPPKGGPQMIDFSKEHVFATH